MFKLSRLQIIVSTVVTSQRIHFFFFFFFFFFCPLFLPFAVLMLQLPVYAAATATRDLSCICDLHHSAWQCQIFNPLSKIRDGTYNLMVPSWICFQCATTGTPKIHTSETPMVLGFKLVLG